MTKRESILQALVTLLADTTAVGSNIFRSRVLALSRDESPSLVIMPTQEEGTEDALGFIDSKLTVQISVYQRGEVPDSLADSIVESVFSKVMADPKLGGLAIDIYEDGTNFEFDDADQEAVWIGMQFIVWYRHARNSLT